MVAIGTSIPELAVGITASLQGTASLAIGNIAGTNIFNILFILGFSALLIPVALQAQIFKLELPVIVIASVLMLVLALDGHLSQLDGALLFIAAIVYTVLLIRLSLREARAAKPVMMNIKPAAGIRPAA